MQPDWDKLTADFAGSETKLIAEIDCTSDHGRDLCIEHDIQGYPTLKFGDPTNLRDYTGERSYDALKAFANEKLNPVCSVKNVHLCNGGKVKMLDVNGDIDMASVFASHDLDHEIYLNLVNKKKTTKS